MNPWLLRQMQLPNAAHAVIPPEKITAYLLNEAHPRGRGKAAFFTRFGFTASQPEVFLTALLTHAKTHAVASTRPAKDGICYAVEGILVTPDGRNPSVLTVWFVGPAQTFPRLVTAYAHIDAHSERA